MVLPQLTNGHEELSVELNNACDGVCEADDDNDDSRLHYVCA